MSVVPHTPTRTSVPLLPLDAVNDQYRAELDAVWRRVRAHGRYVGGPEVGAFESEFAAYCGALDAVGVANGTDALELILTALGIGAGDEVILPANTFVATAEAVRAAGATPVFVDVHPDTLLVDPDAVDAAVTTRTAAVIAVHLFGQPVDVDGLQRVTSRHGLALVEDAAQAHGARFAGRRTGSFGVAAGFSFYPGKNLGALGDGGAVVSDDPHLVETIRSLADHGRDPLDRHRHPASGRNSRLDSLQAGVLSVKLADLDRANERRRWAMRRYRTRLPAEARLLAEHAEAESVHHLCVVRVPDRAAATRALDRAGVGWGVHYPVPCHLHPAFARYATAPLPVCEAAAGDILSLPMSPVLDGEQIDRVCDALEEGLR